MTHTNQSTAQRRETSWTGTSMAVRTINMRTRAALGTLALAILAAVEVKLGRLRGSELRDLRTEEEDTGDTYTTVT